MGQTPEGAIKSAAKKQGISEVKYRLRLASGQKWCSGCKEWHKRSEFGKDSSRWDGVTASCTAYRRRRSKELYEKCERPKPGRRFVEARDGDKKQARRRVNHLVDMGLLPKPNDVACVDCDHECSDDDDRRHEYDHYLGYEAKHHEHVEVVCSKCHHDRTIRRRSGRQEQD